MSTETTSVVLSRAFTRLAPVIGAALGRGAVFADINANRFSAKGELDIVVIIRGTAAEARVEASLMRSKAAELGYVLEGGAQDIGSYQDLLPDTMCDRYAVGFACNPTARVPRHHGPTA